MSRRVPASKKKSNKSWTQYYQRLSLKDKLWKAETLEEHKKIQAKIDLLR